MTALAQITDYASLQAAVAGTLHRDTDPNITGNLPLWIQLCEADLNDDLLLKNSEQEDTLATVSGTNFVALPSGFISPIALWIVLSSVRSDLIPRLPQQLPYNPSSSIPQYYAIDGVNLRFDCPAADVYSLKLRYIKASNLSTLNTSNYLLLKRPDVYLYGTLRQAALFTADDAALSKWTALYVGAKKELKATENRARAQVRLRTDLPIQRRSNIFTG